MNPGNPTELELLVLKVLWQQSPMTARQIREALAQRDRSLAYTSVITTVQRMVDKLQLEQLAPTTGKAFRFTPLIQQQDVSRGMLGDLVDRVFDGSAEAVMMSLFDVKELDEQELAGLQKLLKQKTREAKS